MNTTLLIMAAGLGSRYGGNKQIYRIGPNGEILMEYSIHDALEAGFDKVVFVIRKSMDEVFRTMIGNKIAQKVRVEYAYQEYDSLPDGFIPPEDRTKPYGTVHAVTCAKDVIHEPFAVINGDDFYGKESFKVLGDWCRAHEKSEGEYCIVGFELENTLSENGSVSRGICYYDKNNILTGIAEHLDICKEADGNVYGNNSVTGEQHVKLAAKALCSMNMWGFTPDYFTKSEASFVTFLTEHRTEPKKEYYIPYAVDVIVKGGQAKCEVLSTPSHWFGVTYKEDRPGVVAKFAELVAKGVYPSPLYK